MTAFKLPDGNPTSRAHIEEWADFAEYFVLKNKKIPFNSLFKPVQLIVDEELMDGVEDETDIFNAKTEEIAGEIRKRILYTDGRYPFQLESNDYVISLNNQIRDEYRRVYLFLLYSTRLNMKTDRVHGGYDGALLFEYLCAEVAKNYFGENSHAEVLGTGNEEFSHFQTKLGNLAGKVNEFGVIRTYEHARTQDDKLDVVVWKGFTDNNSSKLLAFGQCKTGTSWVESLSELNPMNFCKTWFTNQPIVDPLKLFFCAQYFPITSREQHIYKAGLLFDRYRIMDYLPDRLSEEILQKISDWCSAVENRYINNR